MSKRLELFFTGGTVGLILAIGYQLFRDVEVAMLAACAEANMTAQACNLSPSNYTWIDWMGGIWGMRMPGILSVGTTMIVILICCIILWLYVTIGPPPMDDT